MAFALSRAAQRLATAGRGAPAVAAHAWNTRNFACECVAHARSPRIPPHDTHPLDAERILLPHTVEAPCPRPDTLSALSPTPNTSARRHLVASEPAHLSTAKHARSKSGRELVQKEQEPRALLTVLEFPSCWAASFHYPAHPVPPAARAGQHVTNHAWVT